MCACFCACVYGYKRTRAFDGGAEWISCVLHALQSFIYLFIYFGGEEEEEEEGGCYMCTLCLPFLSKNRWAYQSTGSRLHGPTIWQVEFRKDMKGE